MIRKCFQNFMYWNLGPPCGGMEARKATIGEQVGGA